MFATVKVKKHWPRLEHLYARASRHAYQDYVQLQYDLAAIEEQRRARDGVRILTLKEFQAGLAKGQILARIPGDLFEWSQWITPTREIAVSLFEMIGNHGDGQDAQTFSTLLDSRGCPIGLYEADTMRLDHFVSWDEILRCYQSWSLYGIPPRDEEGPREEHDDARGRIVIATMDIMQTGAPLPAQPNGGQYQEPPSHYIIGLPPADMQAEINESHAPVMNAALHNRLVLGRSIAASSGVGGSGECVAQYPTSGGSVSGGLGGVCVTQYPSQP